MNSIMNSELIEKYATILYVLSMRYSMTEDDLLDMPDIESAYLAFERPEYADKIIHKLHLENPEIRDLALQYLTEYGFVDRIRIQFHDAEYNKKPDIEKVNFIKEVLPSDISIKYGITSFSRHDSPQPECTIILISCASKEYREKLIEKIQNTNIHWEYKIFDY